MSRVPATTSKLPGALDPRHDGRAPANASRVAMATCSRILVAIEPKWLWSCAGLVLLAMVLLLLPLLLVLIVPVVL